MKETHWTAYFGDVERLRLDYKIIGLNEASKPVAIEFPVEKGAINFQPASDHPSAGDILIDCSKDNFHKVEDLPPPDWLAGITVPDEKSDREQMTILADEISKLQGKFNTLKAQIQEETNIKKLLYEKNEALENIVKESFEELGFTCSKKDDKDWMIDSEIGSGILEVTGSNSSIDIQKLRQLLNYLLDEHKESTDEKKAILVANHFSETPIGKRGEPFTQKAIDESNVHSICLLSTSELFNLICNLRQGNITQKDVQKRIFETSSVFSA